jgi:CspA family cold shock protein
MAHHTPRGSNVPTGTVKFFNTAKGFGFIKQDEDESDAFVHVSAADRAGIQLQEGMRVGFDVEADRKTGKPRAANLRLL